MPHESYKHDGSVQIQISTLFFPITALWDAQQLPKLITTLNIEN